MNRIIVSIMTAALVLTGCTKNIEKSEGTGKLSLNLTYGGEYVTKAADPADFSVTISRTDGWNKSFSRFAEIPLQLELGSGEYTITASSPSPKDAAFDSPSYSGTAKFTIRAGELTPVTLTCTISNVKVTINPSPTFRTELSDYNVTITNASSWTADDTAERTLIWGKADVEAGKAGYFSVAPLLVKVDGYRAIDNSYAPPVMLSVKNVAARDHIIINLDARVTGSAGVSIIVDDSVNEKNEDVFVPGWEEVPIPGDPNTGDPQDPETPVTSTAPVMKWDANPDFAPMPITNPMNVDVTIEAPEKIASFVVTVNSAELAPVIAALAGNSSYNYATDGPFAMDLIGDAVLIESLNGMGLGIPTGAALAGQTSVQFSLSSLIPMIMLYQPAVNSQHIFTLKVTDEKAQSLEKSLTFYVPES